MARQNRPIVLIVTGLLAAGAAGCASGPEVRAEAPSQGAQQQAPEEQGGTELQNAAARALRHVDEAHDAVGRQQATRASQPIAAAIEELKKMEESLPGEPLLGLLERTIADVESDPRKADFTKVRTTARDMEAQLDPAVFRAVEDARFALLAGNPEQAVTRLRDARMALGADTQRMAVERVRTQLEEARTLLGNRDVQAAGRRLGEARSLLREVQALAPLVPVRWNLRAAAAAADDGDWAKAEGSLADASRTLDQIREPQGSPAASEVEALKKQTRTYLRRLDGAQKPTADQLRELASRTLDVRAG